MRTDWDTVCLEMAHSIAKRAACTRSQVGAILLTADKLQIFAGYNGVGPGLLHCDEGGCERGKFTYDELPPLGSYATCSAVHAEENALKRAGTNAKGGTLYVTRTPCKNCWDLIILKYDVSKVVYEKEFNENSG